VLAKKLIRKVFPDPEAAPVEAPEFLDKKLNGKTYKVSKFNVRARNALGGFVFEPVGLIYEPETGYYRLLPEADFQQLNRAARRCLTGKPPFWSGLPLADDAPRRGHQLRVVPRAGAVRQEKGVLQANARVVTALGR
jgi:hypothetical protein